MSDSNSSQADRGRARTEFHTPPQQMQRKKISGHRTLSCLPCRVHKLRCDRRVPCHTCTRYRRESECHQHPAPAARLNPVSSKPATIAPGLNQHKKTTADGSSTISPENTQSPLSQSSVPILIPFSGPLSSIYDTVDDSLPTKRFWRAQLATLLPPQHQCDLLVSYYLENIHWLFHAFHVPTFHRQYSGFWSIGPEKVDLIWLALLFTIISSTALIVPVESAVIVGLETSRVRQLSRVWHLASRQALHAGEFESKPSVMQLQVFIATQLYWLETKNIESLNSAFGQAVRHAQALGLDRDAQGSNDLDTELRRRIWWDLWVTDTFQSMCLDRTPLIHAPAERVPLPQNCNDIDMTQASVKAQPMEVPTDTSACICRAQAYRIFRKLYQDGGTHLSSYEYIRSIDQEIQELTAQFPWYFRIGSTEALRHLPSLDVVAWCHAMLHISVCQQRIRMNRPFLHARVGESWSVCARAAQEMLLPYRQMRASDVNRFRQSQKFAVQGYQAYTAAVTLAAFLLVERSFPGFSSESMRQDIEMVISDLELHDIGPMVSDGIKILRKMLDMFERRDAGDPQMRESLVQEIASVFGGEQPTRRYLRQCDIGYVLNSQTTHGHQLDGHVPTVPGFPESVQDPGTNTAYHQTDPMLDDFHLALDMLEYDQWWDFLLPEGGFSSQ